MGCDVPEERLWSWIDRAAPELEPHLAQCPRCRAMAEELRAGIKTVADGSTPVGVSLPKEIGSYIITGLLGEGGQALVYRAEQRTPRRPVALKVLKGGRLVGDQDVRHFQREIQTLAGLGHPAIATIYEGGQTTEGQHFFAMELIDGVPLDRYARERDLPLPERLELFGRVCAGVQYAHEQGVIHRDLKPSNILINAGGDPKILDFGLARLMNTDVTLTQTATQTGQIMGTLRYMSPGQARGNPAEIDERSDVYSLGVILYELLTGHPPYKLSNVIPEAVRTICETPPRQPSSTLGWDGRPARHLRGDLETIVLKALEKEPTRRYPSVADLAGDVRRHLRGEPIVARRPSSSYVLGKKLSKHRRRIALSAAALVLALAGTALALWWHQQALEAARESRMLQAQVRARQGQYQNAVDLYTLVIDDPRAAAGRTAQYYYRAHAHLCLKEYALAISDYTKAVEYQRPERRAWYFYQRATPLWIVGQRDEAAADYREFRRLRPEVSYADARLFLVLHDQARILVQSGRGADAERLVQEAGNVLTAARDAVVPGSWLDKILECLAGECTPDALVDTANPADAEQRCEAYYYAGEACLLAGQSGEACAWFKRCVETDLVFAPDTYPPGPMNEYHLAVWRLDQLHAEPLTIAPGVAGW